MRECRYSDQCSGHSLCRFRRLTEEGHRLRRPEAYYHWAVIYKLRVRLGSVNYRIPSFFHGQDAAVLTHALTKEAEIPILDRQGDPS